MRRFVVLIVLATVALLALPIMASSALVRPGNPDARALRRATLVGWHCCRRRGQRAGRYRSRYLSDGYARMYVIHGYPRGILATFGCPRPCYGARSD